MKQEEKEIVDALRAKMTPEDVARLQTNLKALDEYEKTVQETKDFHIDLTTTEKDVIREALVKMCWLFEHGFLENPKWHGRFNVLQMAFPMSINGAVSSLEVAIFEWRQVFVALRNMLQLDYSEIEKMKFRDLAKKINDVLPSEGG